MSTPKKMTEYRTKEHRAWTRKNFPRPEPMIESEADIIAKILRNNTNIPYPAKVEVVRDIIKAFMERNQFFNHVRFKDLALQTLPEGWPRDK